MKSTKQDDNRGSHPPQGLETRLELFQAGLSPDSANPDKRTCDMIMYTGASVDRVDYWTGERYRLRLSVDPAHVRLGRINNGAPLLDSHDSYSVRSQLGVIEKGWIEDGQIKATARFSGRDDVKDIWKDVSEGIIRNVSIGSQIHRLQDITADGDKIKSYLAVDWEPFEGSVVAIPADPGAGFLSAQLGRINQDGSLIQSELQRAEPVPPKEPRMNDENLAAAPPAETIPAIVDHAKLKTEAALGERARISGIRKIGSKCNLADDVIEHHIAAGTSLEAFRQIALDAMADASDAGDFRAHRQIESAAVTRDQRESRIECMSQALLHRYQPGVYQLTEGAKEYRGMTLLRLAEQCLTVAGVKTRGLSSMELATRALQCNAQAVVIGAPSIAEFAGMSTSDFPFITANVGNKVLRAAYDQEPQTWRPFCRQANASDFKAKYINQLGDAPSLELVPESGEFKYGSIPEARESYRLYTYGKIMAFTRQLLINDDMSAFTRVAELQGRAVARLENDLIWNQITTNPTMGDGVALFDATTHINLTSSGTAISVDSLGVGRAAMRKQTGLAGTSILNLTPKYLLVPAAKEQLALQYTSLNFVPTTAAGQNVWAGLLTPIVEPRLDADSATAWYLVADPGQIDTIEFAYLEGQEGAYYETRLGFNVDGIDMKVRHDFGRKVIDWRAFYKNAGA